MLVDEYSSKSSIQRGEEVIQSEQKRTLVVQQHTEQLAPILILSQNGGSGTQVEQTFAEIPCPPLAGGPKSLISRRGSKAAFTEPSRGMSEAKVEQTSTETLSFRCVCERCRLMRGDVHNSSRKVAFTLAEVLITLGIIGVVAAITMPVLMQKYKKHVTEVKLKQTYTILSSALRAGELELGEPYSIAYDVDRCPENVFYCHDNVLFENFIKPYVSNNIVEVNSGTCWGNSKCPAIKNTDAISLFGKYVTFPNGTTIIIYNAAISVITDPLSFKSSKPLNLVPGKNYFNFGPAYGICGDGGSEAVLCLSTIPHVLAPFHNVELPSWWYQAARYRGNYTDEQMVQKCKTSSEVTSKLQFCTQLYLENNFTFPDNYPIKF